MPGRNYAVSSKAQLFILQHLGGQGTCLANGRGALSSSPATP
jgi:hypothetical protein